MFLDLWSLVSLTGDFLDLLVKHFESGTFSVSPIFVLSLVVAAVISVFAWRSTNIPDLPPAPRPPYVIQISGNPTPVNNNGERNPLGDVRLLSSSTANVESVLRRFPATAQARAARNLQPNSTTTFRHRVNIASSGGNPNTLTRATVRVYPQIQTSHQPGHHRLNNSSVVLGIVPPNPLQYLQRPGSLPVRPNSSQGAHAQNVIVYHRVNVYHHHLHHPTQVASAASRDSSATDSSLVGASSPPANSAGSISVDSSTQYESADATPQANPIPIPTEIYSENQIDPVDVDVTSAQNPETEEEDIVVDSEEERTPSEDQTNAELSGLRRRNRETQGSTEFQNPRSTQEREATSFTRDSDTSTRAMTDLHQRNVNVGSEKTDGHNVHSAPSSSEQIPTERDIRFTIKFLNDTQMEVTTQAGEKIADFKQRHFAAELSENKTVRLIFNGRVLDNDSSTLRESGIFDQCVVHCLIVSRQPAPGGQSSTGPTGTSRQVNARQIHGFMRAPEPGMFFVAFIGVFLLFLWFVCFHFGQHLFTQSAVASLTVLTAIFLIGLVAFYLPAHPN